MKGKALSNVELPKTISPLRKLLMDNTIDNLFAFLHRMSIQFTVTRTHKGLYKARIFNEGMLSYEAGSNNSAKVALADALAKFLVFELKDFHVYGWKN